MRAGQLPSSDSTLLALILAGTLGTTAVAQPDLPSAAAAKNLKAAVAAAGAGWRTQSLADGHVAAIGAGSAGGASFAVGIACDASKKPQIAAMVRGSDVRALVVETPDMTMTFALDATGATTSAADALIAEPIAGTDAAFKLSLNGHSFPTEGARAALTEVSKDCARAGWDYGKDHDQQMIWTYSAQPDEAPLLTFGKPWTGWLLAQITCDPRKGALIVKSTGIPRRAKTGQAMPLTVRAAGQEFTTTGRIEMYQEGDVAGFLVARFDRPGALLDSLGSATEIALKTGTDRVQVAARALAPLLPLFQAACGLK